MRDRDDKIIPKTYEIITAQDVLKINETLPKEIRIISTKGQNANLLAEINPKVRIKILVEDENEKNNEEIISKKSYTGKELSKIIKYFEDTEKTIKEQENWSNIDNLVYLYSKFIASFTNLEESNDEESNILKCLLTNEPNSEGYARLLKEQLNRLDIPCEIEKNYNGTHFWNVIEIDGKQYPVDLSIDSITSHKAGPLHVLIHNFAKNPEFYGIPEHAIYDPEKEQQKINELIQSTNTLNKEDVQNSLDKVFEKVVEEFQKNFETIKDAELPIKLISKELFDNFKDNTINKNSIQELEELTIDISDDNFDDLKRDIINLATFYPSALDKVKLQNKNGTTIDMQKLVDHIINSRYTKEQLSNNIEKNDKQTKTITPVKPIHITIESSNEKDFEVDFRNIPQIQDDPFMPIDRVDINGSNNKNTIKFKNTCSTPIKFNALIGKNIEYIDLTGFDVGTLNLNSTNVIGLSLTNPITTNISGITGFNQIKEFSLNDIKENEFNTALSNFKGHSFKISNQNLAGRSILKELAINPELSRISIFNSSLDNLDGLKDLDGRLTLLNVQTNNLGPAHNKQVTDFIKNNPVNNHLDYYLNNNTGNTNIINSIYNLISDDTYNFIKDYTNITGSNYKVINKKDSIEYLLWSQRNIPIYINDAKIIRSNLNITSNPMMIKDNDLETFNFNDSDVIDGTLLLTKDQIEHLISQGKTVPQKILIQLNTIKDLSISELNDLQTRMNNNGMNLEGIQIIDNNFQTGQNPIAPYTINQYKEIRTKIDLLVSNIDMSEPDLDKFAVIYQRLSDSIDYDYDAIKYNNKAECIYYADVNDTCRNLYNGLTKGTCVCAGYSDILKNALDLVGIKSRYVRGLANKSDSTSGHAWNQVLLDDGTGNKRWYYSDLTWDCSRLKGSSQTQNNDIKWTLKGSKNFTKTNYHFAKTLNLETVENKDYNEDAVLDAFDRAKTRSFDLRIADFEINIPDNPDIPVKIENPDKLLEEFNKRKSDMYAKYYGDKDYQSEYLERSARYQANEIEKTDGTITYRTIRDYPEKAEDEDFLLLDQYKERLERVTKYEAGDTSVYQGTDNQIQAQIENDREYIETKNHTFDQHKNTRTDLATLGKFGERLPYIPKTQGTGRTILRAIGNVGIFTHNLVAPVYRAIGRGIAVPIHRLVMRNKESSPFRNNWYHRMVARRNYFTEKNTNNNPNKHLTNGIKSRIQAIFNYKEGNEAVLRAGAYDIRQNIQSRSTEQLVLENLTERVNALTIQISQLENDLIAHPCAINNTSVQQAINDKKALQAKYISNINDINKNKTGISQTDAISDKEHAIASKEVNTLRTTVIKGIAKGITARYIGPKITTWLANRGKHTETVTSTIQVPVEKQKWVPGTTKTQVVPIYENQTSLDGTISSMIAGNKGKNIQGFYSVYGGEYQPSNYTLTGNEGITAIFKSKGDFGTGFSDTVNLQAPTLVDGTFDSSMLDTSGLLNQNLPLEKLVKTVNSGIIDNKSLDDIYVSIQDRYWARLSDLTDLTTKSVQTGTKLNTVVDVAGHYETYTDMVDKIITTSKIVNNPAYTKIASTANKIGNDAFMLDNLANIIENLRTTTTDVKSNKPKQREYTFDDDMDDIVTTRKAYRNQKQSIDNEEERD